MPKDTKKKKNSLYLELSDKAHKNLSDVQATRQLKDGKRTPLKILANEGIENMKA